MGITTKTQSRTKEEVLLCAFLVNAFPLLCVSVVSKIPYDITIASKNSSTCRGSRTSGAGGRLSRKILP